MSGGPSRQVTRLPTTLHSALSQEVGIAFEDPGIRLHRREGEFQQPLERSTTNHAAIGPALPGLGANRIDLDVEFPSRIESRANVQPRRGHLYTRLVLGRDLDPVPR
jgi:hypothetical protein